MRYDTIGTTYGRYRRPDARIAAQIEAALGASCSVVDIGAGTGSYEPSDRRVVAVEPAMTMIRQRASGAAPAVQGVAEHMPFPDDAFDAALAVLTTHHWSDVEAGLREMQRIAPVQVVLTWDQQVSGDYWLVAEYMPEVRALDADLAPLEAVVAGLPDASVTVVPVPWDCTDGFLGAYWRRPEWYLDPDARAAISGFALSSPAAVDRAVAALEADLDSGAWRERHADLLDLEELDIGYRLVTSRRR